MPSPEKRVRVERGLYKTGNLYYACTTPPGSCTATWKALGAVRLMEARRLRDRFCAVRHSFASILIAQGHDPAFVSRQLGHANAAIALKVYAHLFDAERHARDARRQLEAEYGSLLTPEHTTA